MSHIKTHSQLGFLSTVRASFRTGITLAMLGALCTLAPEAWSQNPNSNPNCKVPTSRAKKVAHGTAAPATSAPAVDWTTLPSTYTHDATGQRVDQYAQIVEPEGPSRADFVRSGYTHTRSSLQVGFNADHYHVTEQWGPQVRPYGEWRYPFRPFAVPYGAWGPQLPQVAAGGIGFGPWGFPGAGGWGQVPPGGFPNGGFPNGGGQNGGGPNGGAPNGWMQQGAGQMGAGQMQGMGPGMQGSGVPVQGMPPGGHPGMQPGYGHPQGVPWWGYPGVSPYPPFGGVGPFGVGPGNALAPIQEDYYPQAPIYQQPSDGYFNSPYRNVP
jgi:hypothetical protein